MTQNIDMRTGTPKTLRTILVPAGIVTAVLGVIYLFLYTGALTTSGEGTETAVEKMLDAARYMAIVFAFITLIIAGIMIAHSILQLRRLNKSNLKWELISGIVNAVVGLLMFIFFIVVMTTVFKEEKWYGDNMFKNASFMGILTSLSVYAFVFGLIFNKAKYDGKNTNVKMLRTIALFAFVLALVNLIPTILTLVGGFVDVKSQSGAEDADKWLASAIAAKFTIAAFGTIALGILTMIPLAILGINDKAVANKNVITWSVIGGIIFIFFIIAAAMMTLKDGAPQKWIVDANNTTITVFVLLSEIACVAGGSIAFVKTKANAPKIAQAQ